MEFDRSKGIGRELALIFVGLGLREVALKLTGAYSLLADPGFDFSDKGLSLLDLIRIN